MERIFEVDPQLAEFDVPILDFFASKPEHNAFIIGAFILSWGRQPEFYDAGTRGNADRSLATSHGTEKSTQPRALLMRRALSDSLGGLWEGPGGSCDDTDATVLDSVAREVFEETGLHVSRIRSLVAVDSWERSKPERPLIKAVKYSFFVDVHEANPKPGNDLFDPDWEHKVKVAPGEHDEYRWVTEDDIRKYLTGEDEIKLTFPMTAKNYLLAFDVFNGLNRALVE